MDVEDLFEGLDDKNEPSHESGKNFNLQFLSYDIYGNNFLTPIHTSCGSGSGSDSGSGSGSGSGSAPGK